jgi:ubiquinone/menaquinone biosynthesis C-methylase UbiE
MNENEIINAARNGFDDKLHSERYNKIHSDDEQRKKIINLLDIKENRNYLDLGTGNGYIAFYLARNYPKINVFGLDIALKSIEKNNEIKKNEKINNINIYGYYGGIYPFPSGYFYTVISRYAFHHFPNIYKSISEISRVLENNGYFLLSDPQTNEEDIEGFIDKFQIVKNDGHIHFYRRREIEDILKEYKFVIVKEFTSTVKYPRDFNEEYDELLKKTTGEILKKYNIERIGNEVYVTVNVSNILFMKIS